MISRKSPESRIADRTGQDHAGWLVCLLAWRCPLPGGATTRSNDFKVFIAGHGLPVATEAFAIHDLDGDLAPRRTSVQAVSNNPSHTNCIARLGFPSGNRRSIRTAADGRAVQVVARNANGDLKISSAWTDRARAVQTDDGNSASSMLDPSRLQALSLNRLGILVLRTRTARKFIRFAAGPNSN